MLKNPYSFLLQYFKLFQLASLIQWFDKVITETILKDLDKANKEVIIR